jgi:hypothetical protein
MEKVREYLHFGVSWVWVIDPVALTGQVHSQSGVVSIEDRIFATDRFSVDLSKAEIRSRFIRRAHPLRPFLFRRLRLEGTIQARLTGS